MKRIPLLILVVHLLLMGSIARAQEPGKESPPPSGTAPAPQSPQAPAPSGTAPAAGPSTSEHPELVPVPSSPSTTTEAPKEEKVQKALEQPEETKKKVETSPELEIIKGKLQMEVVETYVSSSSNQIFIEGFGILPILIVGNVEVQRIRRDSFISTLTTRYKLSQDLQLAINVPYVYILNRTTTAAGIAGNTAASPNKETLSRNYGLGDVNGSLNYELLNEGLVRPSISVALGFKARTGQDIFQSDNPTGSGFNSISASLNFSKFADPAGIFGYLSYAYAVPRNNVVFRPPNNQPAVLIDFMPGDNFGLGFGIAYALNYKVSLSMQYQQSVNLSSRINGKKLPNSEINAISLRFGVIWRVNANLSVDLSVSPGLTLDAPDSVVALRLPWRF